MSRWAGEESVASVIFPLNASYFATRNLRCVTPGASITIVLSSSIGSAGGRWNRRFRSARA